MFDGSKVHYLFQYPYCCVCFTELTSSNITIEDDGQRVDVCQDCTWHEWRQTVAIFMLRNGTYPAIQFWQMMVGYQKKVL
jgi:Zn-finger protein